MILPLDGVRVLDLSVMTTGPFCTRMLADYGADVLKIEPPAGDPARRHGPFFRDEPDAEKSGLFLFLNANKRAITLNPSTERGRLIFLELVREADIVVENFKPGVMAELGLSYEELRAVNPRTVVTSVTNFGQDGPYRDWEATDLTLYAMGGSMLANGDPDLEPVKTAGQMASYHAGYCAALATTIALWRAERTGEGDHVDVSFFETAMQSTDSRLLRILGYQYNNYTITGRLSMAAIIGLGTGVYPCVDGYFELTAGVAMFERIARMIGAERLFEDPNWNTPTALAVPERADEFNALLVPWCLERTKQQIREACMEFGVLGAPVNTVGELFDDPSFKSRGFFQTIDHPAVGPLTYPGYNFRVHAGDGEPMPGRRPAPLLGQHTVEVLNGIGIEGAEVARLRSQGVV